MNLIFNIRSCSCNNRKVTKKLTEKELFALKTGMKEKFPGILSNNNNKKRA